MVVMSTESGARSASPIKAVCTSRPNSLRALAAASPDGSKPETAPTQDKVEQPAEVKSLDELMGEVDDEDAKEETPIESPPKVKTLEELMNDVD